VSPNEENQERAGVLQSREGDEGGVPLLQSHGGGRVRVKLLEEGTATIPEEAEVPTEDPTRSAVTGKV